MWSAHETRSINSAVAQQRSFSSKSPLEKLLERRVHNRTPHCRTANDSATNPAAPRTELLCAPRPNPRELTRNGTVYLVVFGSFLLIGPMQSEQRVGQGLCSFARNKIWKKFSHPLPKLRSAGLCSFARSVMTRKSKRSSKAVAKAEQEGMAMGLFVEDKQTLVEAIAESWAWLTARRLVLQN